MEFSPVAVVKGGSPLAAEAFDLGPSRNEAAQCQLNQLSVRAVLAALVKESKA
jgi:hypothetical protein